VIDDQLPLPDRMLVFEGDVCFAVRMFTNRSFSQVGFGKLLFPFLCSSLSEVDLYARHLQHSPRYDISSTRSWLFEGSIED
jgi:hypothetical protein